MLSSHMMWLLWGIISAYHSDVTTYGFLDYAVCRWKEFLRLKQELVAKYNLSL